MFWPPPIPATIPKCCSCLFVCSSPECTKIAHRRSLAIFFRRRGIARNFATRIIFTRFHRRENRGSLAIFFAEAIAHLGATKVARYFRERYRSPPQPQRIARFWCTPWSSFPCFFGFPYFFSLQGIPCLFERFSLLSQGFWGFGKDEKSLFLGCFSLSFSKKARKRRSGLSSPKENRKQGSDTVLATPFAKSRPRQCQWVPHGATKCCSSDTILGGPFGPEK